MGKNKNKLPDVPKTEDVIKFFEAIRIPKLSIACLVGMGCGLRVSESCKIENYDIDFENRRIKIRDGKDPNRAKHGNYGKDRFVTFPRQIISPLRKWLEITQGGKWFLPGEKSPDIHLRAKTLHEWFADTRKRAGLDKEFIIVNRKNQSPYKQYRFHYHSLRHWYATNHYEKNRDIYSLSQLLGHARLETTAIYARCSNAVLRDTVDKAFAPREQVIQKSIPQTKMIKEEINKNEIEDPIRILKDRLAKGQISQIEYRSTLQLLKLTDPYMKESKEENSFVTTSKEDLKD